MPVRSNQILPRGWGGYGAALVGLAGLALVALVWVTGPRLGIFLPGTSGSGEWQAVSPGAERASWPGRGAAADTVTPSATTPSAIGGSVPAEPDPAQLTLLRRLLQIGRFIDTTTAALLLPALQPDVHPDAATRARREALLADRAAAMAEHERLRQQLLALLPPRPAVPPAGEPPIPARPAPDEAGREAAPGGAASERSVPEAAGRVPVPGFGEEPAPGNKPNSGGAPEEAPGRAGAAPAAPAPVPAPPVRPTPNNAPRATARGAPGTPAGGSTAAGAAQPAARPSARAPDIANGPHCHTVLLRAQLGEELSLEDQGVLRRGCRASP